MMWFDAKLSAYFAELLMPHEAAAKERRKEEDSLIKAGSRGWRGTLEGKGTRYKCCVMWRHRYIATLMTIKCYSQYS